MNDHILDFFDHIPSKEEKIEMRKTSRSPSEWLRLLCRDWAIENEETVVATDLKFLGFKSYLRGRLSSQLLCRLSIPETHIETAEASPLINRHIDFWGVLGILDDFDKSYIISQIERFCALYSIRAVVVDDDLIEPSIDSSEADQNLVIPGVQVPTYLNGMVTKDPRYMITADQKEVKNRHREAAYMRRAVDRATREASREEKRQKKLKLRQSREQAIKLQKEAALARAEELVRSNRVPIEITRGAAAAQAAADAAVEMMGVKQTDDEGDSKKRHRSDIIVSTASDLNRIVTHAKNLWTKYNAIAKEHNQKVSWGTVAKELGIHVKVREKYARMHARALQRGFDFKTCGHFKIKEYPMIFLEPLAPQQQKMKYNIAPNPASDLQVIHQPQEQNHDLLQQQHHLIHHNEVSGYNKDISDEHHHISDAQVAAAVDAAIKTVPAPDDNCYDDAAATVDTVMDPNNGHPVD